MINQYDYMDEGFKIFGLHGVDSDGVCCCGNPDCKALYKHPRAGNWQSTPNWSDDQLEVMEELGYFSTGYGVLCKGWIIIDIDPRNGGTIEQVQEWFDNAGFIIETGGGGWHIYYKLPEGDESAYVQHLDKYKGIDFKTTGYVVGCGSLHASGNHYDIYSGSIDKITEAPKNLLDELKKPDRYRATTADGVIDVTVDEVREMLAHVDPDCDYDTWIKCGMALHHVLNGTGLEEWDEWSKNGKKYNGFDGVQRHWHSFGKSASPVGLGTLIHYAEQGGYQSSVEFETNIEFEESQESIDVDLLRPPGFVGELTEWINSQCHFPRERLAVGAALSAISSIAGMRYVDQTNQTANLFILCVAGSGTGKEAIQQSYAECIRAADIGAALHGSIKSEQEIMRNMIANQASFYCLDEFGYLLKKLTNASRSGASYLEGVISLLMSAYTKADSYLPMGGDLKRDMKELLKREIAECQKAVDNNEDKFGEAQRRLTASLEMLKEIDKGIRHPFINLIGFSTPSTFNSSVDFEMATNGFIARSMLINEPDTNPKRKKEGFNKGMPMGLQMQLAALKGGGEFGDTGRIEYKGKPTQIPDDKEASDLLDQISDHFWQAGEDCKGMGLEAIPRRGYELVAKISLLLAIPGGVRTVEHVKWAFELVKRDHEFKTRLARSNDVQKDDPREAIALRVQSVLSDSESGETQGVLVNRCRPHKKPDVLAVLKQLVDKKLIKAGETKNPKNGRKSILYQIT